MNDTPAINFNTEFMNGLERSLQHSLQFECRSADHTVCAAGQGHTMRALHWAVTLHRCLPLAVDVAVAWHAHFLRTGHWLEWKDCLVGLVEAAGWLIDGQRRFDLMHYLTIICSRQGYYAEAIEWGEQVMALALDSANERWQIIAANLLAEVYLATENYASAQQYAKQTVQMAASNDKTLLLADAWINAARANLGAVIEAAGGPAQVEQHYLTPADTVEIENWLQQALLLAEMLDSSVYCAKAHLFMHHTLAARGAWAQALSHGQQALALVASYGDHAGRGVVLQALGRSLAGLGRRREAITALQEAITIHEQHNNRPARSLTQQRLQALLQQDRPAPPAHREYAWSS